MTVRPHVVKPMIALVAAAAFAGAGAESEPKAATSRPPIVIYLVDTLRPDHLAVYGYERETAPQLTRFARDAVVFDNAYAPTPWTRPSSATLLTGLAPVAHGARAARHKLDRRARLLSEHLRPLGYHSVGVVANPHVLGFWGFDRGYDAYYDVGASATQWHHSGANDAIRAIFRHMDGQPEGPFFYYLHTIEPHAPYNPLSPYDQLFTDAPRPVGLKKLRGLRKGATEDELRNLNAMYDAEIYYSDLQFGRLLERLRERGLYDEALIVFVSDHGEEHLEHGDVGHGKQLFDESLRIPMVVKLPGNAHAGRRIAEPVMLADVVPTVLELLGEEVPQNLTGRSLLGHLVAEPVEKRPLHFDLEKDQGKSVHVARAVRLGSWKYIREVAPDRREWLFDLSADPDETRNQLESSRARADELSTLMDAHLSSFAVGAHLHFAGRGGDKVTIVQGRLRTEGRLKSVRTIETEQEDEVELGPSAQVLSIRFNLRGFRNQLGGVDQWVQDVDAIAFEVEPPDAPVVFEHLGTGADGGALPLFLGSERAQSPGLPQPLELRDPALTVYDAGDLFSGEARKRGRIEAGAYFFVVPEPAALEAREDVPEAIQERLRALGYVD